MAAVDELAAIPFGTLIGAPLNAAIEAQAKAALTTVAFIRAVGFKEVEDEKKNKQLQTTSIAFKYRTGPEPTDLTVLEVPLLTIVPIPFLRIANLDIHFKASLSQSTETKDTNSESFGADAKMSASANYWCAKVEMSGSVSSKKDSSSTRDSRYAVEYTMDISVHAVQDDVPAGLARMLNLLNEQVDRSLQATKPTRALPNGQGK